MYLRLPSPQSCWNGTLPGLALSTETSTNASTPGSGYCVPIIAFANLVERHQRNRPGDLYDERARVVEMSWTMDSPVRSRVRATRFALGTGQMMKGAPRLASTSTGNAKRAMSVESRCTVQTSVVLKQPRDTLSIKEGGTSRRPWARGPICIYTHVHSRYIWSIDPDPVFYLRWGAQNERTTLISTVNQKEGQVTYVNANKQ
ncbi:hypothetical protein BD414DRAFT_212504 [Trametes punicea]|nr:hypothetical protein BD414DRAFT_212504 [Trametes punicea]